MTITLGVPQIRGKSDVVNSYKAVTEIEPGYAVKRISEDEVALFDGTGIPMGVSGYREIKGNKVVAVVEEGKSVGVLLADPSETIEVGSQALITVDGKWTATASTDTTPTAATFVSDKGDGVNVVTGAKVAGGAVKIDFTGGF